MSSDLVLLKVAALLHDPPHKSFLIAGHGVEWDFGEFHRRVAASFRQTVLDGTILGGVGLSGDLQRVVVEADRIASSFDRWVFRSLEWTGGSYIYYNHLHNLFKPEITVELGRPPGSGDVEGVARDLNSILREVDRLTAGEKPEGLTLYNTLYTLLEPLWYTHKLPPSLADTRTPNHTVFDHLYAAAAIVNMLATGGRQEQATPSGYYTVIDFPGVQRFINSARKTGDAVISSWILSNTVWSVAEHFMNTYGYDVLVSPTPRLNPYTLRTLIAKLLNLDGRGLELTTDLRKHVEGSKIKQVVERIITTYATLYSLRNPYSIGTLWLQPIIPATATLLLPSYSTVDEVQQKIYTIYREAWKNTVDFAEHSLDRGGDSLTRVLSSILRHIRSIVEKPPQGLNILVVDVESVYRGVRECIVEDEDAVSTCRELGLSINRDELKRIVGENRLEELAKSLLWHILSTRATALARSRRYGRFYTSTPRPFWILRDGGLSPISTLFEKRESGWTPCTLCGDEPAAIVLRKTVKAPNQVEVRREDIEAITQIAVMGGVEEQDAREGVKTLVNYIFKPGEALGPYCILKRALYTALRKDLEILSTDDVALSAISKLLHSMGVDRLGNLERYISRSDFEYLFTPAGEGLEKRIPFKDIQALAQGVGIAYEDFVRRVSEGMKRLCLEEIARVDEGYRRVLESIASIMGLESSSKVIELVKSLGVDDVDVEALCSFLGLRTRYAIVRGDADDIGRILSGLELMEVESYIKHVVGMVRRRGRVLAGGGRPGEDAAENVFKQLESGYRRAQEILGAVGLQRLPVSPSVHQSISLSLILTALSDYTVVRERYGMLVYSGGDDVTALLPVETAIDAVYRLRREFFSSGFKMVYGVPVSSSIPTGRSFSLRIADIMDVMSSEMSTAMELLEEKAKSVKWSYTPPGKPAQEFAKDALVVSSSRSNTYSLLPLSAIDGGDHLEGVREIPILLLTILSTGTPEDYARVVDEFDMYMPPEDLYKFLLYIVKRNTKVRSEVVRSSIVSELSGRIARLPSISLSTGFEKSNGVRELMKYIAIVRGSI